MIASKNITKIIISIIIFSFELLSPVGALELNSATNAAQGIEISPALVELNVSRGQTYSIDLNVMNVTASDMVYNSSVNDFSAADETGSPKISLDSKLPNTASINTWLGEIPQFTLKPRQYKSIVARVAIPWDAEPGGHYGVLRFFGDTPELKAGNVGLTASAGLLILLRVDGVINESASLASFFSSQADKQSFFFESSPIKLIARIKNEGNIHIKPFGKIELRDTFGKIVSTIPLNADQANVLPDSIRKFEVEISEKWMIGRYTASLNLGYGTTGQAIVSTISFWVIPYKLIISALLVLITIIYVLVRLVRVYNRHIIAKSKNEEISKNKKASKK
ncbi:MAG: hypothetical protein WCQ49_03090 [Candidatus Saccharibacteria bacterium]